MGKHSIFSAKGNVNIVRVNLISRIQIVSINWLAVIIFILGLGFSGNLVYAQNIEELERLSARLDSIAISFLNNGDVFENTETDAIPYFFYDSTNTYSDLAKTEIELLNTRQEVLSSDYGIDLQAGLLQNLDQGVFGAEGIFYQRRAQIGVQWNILKNGLFENKETIEKLSSDIEISEKRAQAVAHQQKLDLKMNQLRVDFNEFKEERTKKYLNILEAQKYALTRLYEKNYVTLDKVLDVNSKIMKAETAIENSERVGRYLNGSGSSTSTAENYPVYDIDLEKLGREGLVFYEELSFLQQSTEYKFYNELSLSTYLRYNLYGGTNPQNTFQNSGSREFFSAGISVSLPIPLNTNGKRSIHEQEEKIRELRLADEKDAIKVRLFERYRAYQGALQEFITVYQNILLQQDKIRVQRVRRTIGSDMYSPSELLNAISQLYSASLQVLDVKEELYLRLLEIQSLIPDQSLSAYLIPFDMDGTQYQSNPDYGLYMWSAGLQNANTESINNELKSEGIQKLYVSAGPDKEYIDQVRYLVDSGSDELEVYLMIGDPNLIFEDGPQKLEKHVAVTDSIGATGVHLDIEPHTLDDWDENAAEYLQAYIEMLTQVRDQTLVNNLSLSISITGDYKPIYEDLESLTDKIVLMTYGNNDFEAFSQRFGDVILDAPLGTAIALRAGDFESLLSMEEFMQNIKEAFGVNEFIVHDYESWKQMKNN